MFLIPKYIYGSASNLSLLVLLLETFLTPGGRFALELRVKSGSVLLEQCYLYFFQTSQQILEFTANSR